MHSLISVLLSSSWCQGLAAACDCGTSWTFLLTFFSFNYYEGQSVNSDNGSISQEILVESELFVTQNVDMGVAYSCLKYGIFIMNRFDVMRICIQHCECLWPQMSPF